MIEESKVYSFKPRSVQVGRHTIEITPPNNAWWLEAFDLIGEFYGRARAAQNLKDISLLTLGNLFKTPSLAALNHLALTIDRGQVFPYRRKGWRIVRREPGEWFIESMTPQELALFVQAWIDVVGLEEIKDVFRAAGEKAGLKGILAQKTNTSSPA